jgi:hypothetical protein
MVRDAVWSKLVSPYQMPDSQGKYWEICKFQLRFQSIASSNRRFSACFAENFPKVWNREFAVKPQGSVSDGQDD